MIRAVVIDDSADLRSVTKLWLELDGAAEVIGQAGNGFEGFRLLDAVDADVVVVDVHMPGLDGLGLIRLLRHRATSARLIAYSADETVLAEAMAAGADVAVLKNGESEALLAAVAAAA